MALCLLHLCADGATAYLRTTGAYRASARFGQADAAFSAWLGAHPRMTLRVMADLPDEQFLIDALPILRGQERRQLIERRRSRLFASTPFVGIRPLGRADGRETLLFHALTRPAALQPWLDALRHAGARLDGLHSVADAMAALRPHLPSGAPTCAIAGLTHTGLRLTALVDKHPQWSRLVPATAVTDLSTDLPNICNAARDHLVARRLLHPEHPLPVVLLPGLETFAGALGAGLQAIAPSATELARRCRLPPPGPHTDALPYILYGAGRRGLPQFVPPDRLTARPLRAVDQAILLAGATAAAIGAAVAIKFMADTRALSDTDARLTAEVVATEDRLSRVNAALPPPPAGDPLAATQSLSRLQDARNWPTRLLDRLSDLLEAEPDSELKSVEWQLPPDGPPVAVAEIALPAALADTPPALAARLDRLRAAVISAGYVQASLERVPDELDTTRSVRLRPAPEAQPRVVVRFSPAPPP